MLPLTDREPELIALALAVRARAYAPYSHYQVGAALLAASGRIYTGVNVENAAYPTGLCAERTAAAKAVCEGDREFTRLVVATPNGGMPCGVCRQFLAEFGLDVVILTVDANGTLGQRLPLRALLPAAFGPAQLK